MIRRMGEEDIPQIAMIEKTCFADAWSLSLLKEMYHSLWDTCFVCEESGIVVGYCNLRIVAGGGEIERIAVMPNDRGCGIGKKLMDAMVGFAKENEVHGITLEVRAGNLTAKNLYKIYGFEEIAIRRAYYQSPIEDASIMQFQKI